MASPVEEIQQLELTSIAIEQGNILESPSNDPPKAKVTFLKVTVFVSRVSRIVKGLLGSGIRWIVVLVEGRLIGQTGEKCTLAGEGVPMHGNGMPIEPSHDAGDVEDGGSMSINSLEGFSDNPVQDGTRGLISEEADQVSVGSVLLNDITDAATVAEYLRRHETYLAGLLIYEFNSSLGTLKEGFQKPTPAMKALWYLLFVNVGTIFMLFIMLALAPKVSDKAKILMKCMSASGVSLFGLNLVLLYIKYQP